MVYTTTTYPKDLESLLADMGNISAVDRDLIERAYYRAEKAHEGLKRKSGEPYFTHCLAVATILAEMKLDSETIAAGLLHDVVEDTPITSQELEAEFGTTIARMVDGVTKLAKLPTQTDKPSNGNGIISKNSVSAPKDLEFFRKMMLTMDSDIRVVLVKLADRLHNMRTLGYMAPDKQRRIAQETTDIYVPLANRLGIWQIKWELEDLSFRYLQPDEYKSIAVALQERRADREAYVAKIAEVLRTEMEKYGITNAHITARPKHIASIYTKMHRKGVPLEQVYDVRAVRVIVDELPQCYMVLGIVHQLWRPIPGEFDDYIGSPKDNFYRSLHTAVMDDKGRTLEVQIRTWQMHEDAEYGIAAHWRYKEGGRTANDERFEKRIAFLRRLMEFGTDGTSVDPQEFYAHVKSNFFEGRIYVFTPKGDIIDLPVGSTPIDFAYTIHTEIGHRCRGAKVRGKLVPLNHVLQTGDQIEILTAKRGGPTLDWLNPNAGYATSSRAREKIRHFFRKEHRDSNLSSGRNALERELRRLGVLDKLALDVVATMFEYGGRLDDFLVEVGMGNITGAQIAGRVLEEERNKREAQMDESEELQARLRAPASSDISDGVTVMGAEGMMLNIARCCNPLPGDPIVGYVTRGRGLMVHRADCTNILATNERERLLEIKWGARKQEEQRYNVPIEVVAHDRAGLLRDISALISEMNINISSVEVVTKRQIATLYINLQIATNDQLTRVLSKLEQIPSVVEARRRNNA